MRASVLFEQGKPLSVEELELEPPRTGEVLVRMAASGVCHSCLHAADGSWKGVPVPIVLGDEGAGVVEEVGPGVDELEPGDHVILSWAPTCGRCHYCVIGRPNLCERRQPGRGVLPDGTTRMSLRGRAVYHYGHVATYASSTVVHESCAIKIDKSDADRPGGAHRLLGDDRRRRRHQHGGGAAGRQHRGVRRRRRRAQRGAGRRARRRAPGHRGRREGRQARARARAGRHPRGRRLARGRGRRPSAASRVWAPTTRSWRSATRAR